MNQLARDIKGIRQLGPSTWVMEGPTNIGFIETEKGIFLVDSGNDKESGRKINKVLKGMGWTLAGVINTHSNADHIGGNDYLQRNLACEIYTPEIEAPFTEYPQLEAAFLWGGMPIKDLDNKFFKAKPSRVDHRITGDMTLAGGIKTHALKGHFFDMVGIETMDHVLFTADCMFGPGILEKYKLPFIYDVKEYKKTIQRIKNTPAACYVPSHGEIVESVDELAELNLSVVDQLEQYLLELLAEKNHYDLILKAVCDHYGISLDYGQYALVGSTIRSFLSYLYNEGKIGCAFTDNILFCERL